MYPRLLSLSLISSSSSGVWACFRSSSQASARTNSIYALPTLRGELEEIGFEVVEHRHLDERRKGINEWTSRSA